jgi:hypothetical protein
VTYRTWPPRIPVSAKRQQSDGSMPGGLLEAVERSVKSADHVGTRRVNKPGWLTAVNCLSEKTMQEGILDIQLMHGPRASECKGEHRADCSRLHHWTESLIIVNTRPLSETPENPTSLVPLESAISPALVCPDPLAGDDIGAGGRGTRSQVRLARRAAYSSIAWRQ